METRVIIKENWLTRKPKEWAAPLTWMLGLLLAVTGSYFLNAHGASAQWMAASGEDVFQNREYWRLWTTLFAHGDLGHLLSNSMLFIPFAYLLSAYYGPFFFPLVGLFIGGLINWTVLQTMPATVGLIGISGVVSWMGAAWLTLFLMIDGRASFRRRFAIVFLLTFVLFVPDTYKQNVSYVSHLIGFAFGVVSALIYYGLNRKKFEAAVLTEVVEEDDGFIWDFENSVHTLPVATAQPFEESSEPSSAALRATSSKCAT